MCTITSWQRRPLSLWVSRSIERPTAQLSLSCKSAAVQDMTATALAGPLRGVEHFQGNHLKNDNLRHCWDINYMLYSWKISKNSCGVTKDALFSHQMPCLCTKDLISNKQRKERRKNSKTWASVLCQICQLICPKLLRNWELINK